jgi:hypothetical protein
MKCDKVKEKIDQFVFEEQEPGPATKLHLKTCASCNAYFNDSISTRTVIESLRSQEPRLKEPELLTNNIVNAISSLPEKHFKDSYKPKTIHLFQRILAAVLVTLLMVFGIEEYIVVDKVIRLQTETSSVSAANTRQNFIQYNKAYDLTVVLETIQNDLASNLDNHKHLNLKTMLAMAQFKSADFDQYDLQRFAQLKSLIQNQTQVAHE